ncbi:MAG: hypothetical protein M5U12_30730 [Verrucomicrobia bacterium]|nr:hypothetical protein [Verrucomicrobiota bacterium]
MPEQEPRHVPARVEVVPRRSRGAGRDLGTKLAGLVLVERPGHGQEIVPLVLGERRDRRPVALDEPVPGRGADQEVTAGAAGLQEHFLPRVLGQLQVAELRVTPPDQVVTARGGALDQESLEQRPQPEVLTPLQQPVPQTGVGVLGVHVQALDLPAQHGEGRAVVEPSPALFLRRQGLRVPAPGHLRALVGPDRDAGGLLDPEQVQGGFERGHVNISPRPRA